MRLTATSIVTVQFALLYSSTLNLISSNGLAAKKNVARGGGGFGKAVAKETSYHPSDTVDVYELCKFLGSQNAKIDAVEVGVDKISGMGGLYSKKSFKKGQVVCRIPSDCGLALSDPATAATQEDSPTLVQQGANLLSMYFDDEVRRDLWKPYLDTLPSAVTTSTPNLWSDEEIQLLEFPRIMNMARERRQEIEQVAGEKGIDQAKLEHAAWIVSSRSLPLSIAKDDGLGQASAEPEYDDRGQVLAKANQIYIRVLVPILDMVNYANMNDSADGSNVRLTILDPAKDNAWFALEATRNIPAGRELRMAYSSDSGGGSVDSIELLANYGMVAEENPIDSYVLGKDDDDVLSSQSAWTTTLEEDEALLELMKDDADGEPLRTILKFRRQLKKSYGTAK